MKSSSSSSLNEVEKYVQRFGRGELCGKLWKRSKSNPEKWRQKWFTLKDNKLWYCNSQRNANDFTYINLVGVDSVRAATDKTAPRYCFEINAPHRLYQLRANSGREMEDWIKALRKRVEIVAQNQFLTVAEYFICDTERAVANKDISLMKERASIGGVMMNPSTASALEEIMRADDSEYLLEFVKDMNKYKKDVRDAQRRRNDHHRDYDSKHREERWILHKQAGEIYRRHGVVFKDEKAISARLETFLSRTVENIKGDVEEKKEEKEDDKREDQIDEPPSLVELLNLFEDIEQKVRTMIREKGFRKLTTTKLYWRWVRNATS